MVMEIGGAQEGIMRIRELERASVGARFVLTVVGIRGCSGLMMKVMIQRDVAVDDDVADEDDR